MRVGKYFQAGCTACLSHSHSMQQCLVICLLFDAFWNVIRRMYFIISPCGEVNITPAPAPSVRLDPSKCMCHVLDKSGGPVFCSSVHSATNSDKICDLIAFLSSYVMSRGEVLFPKGRHVP